MGDSGAVDGCVGYRRLDDGSCGLREEKLEAQV